MSSAIKNLTKYFTSYQEGDATPPKSTALSLLSERLDREMESAINEFSSLVTASQEHKMRVQALKVARRCAGSFSESKIIMKDVSEFEQMLAINEWLATTNIHAVHTFHLAASSSADLDKDDHIPVFVRPRQDDRAGMMHVMLGATQGDRVAPKYTDWSAEDPYQTAEQKVFIRPLRTLEVIRQPRYSFAKVVKELAQEEDLIDNAWAYGKKYWSVEGPGQSRPITQRSQKFKSAAFNTCNIVKEYSTEDDPKAEEVKLTPDIDYRDFCNEGYDDDLDMSVSAADLVAATQKSFINKNDGPLHDIMQSMALQFIGPVKTKALADRFVEIITVQGKHP